ncbi:hypothetical protein CGRA01v4_11389 [Colletotrichum graminicola]|nr:hypothetical protein CGRA01v4_11389 [Colletotrichum graminicola]
MPGVFTCCRITVRPSVNRNDSRSENTAQQRIYRGTRGTRDGRKRVVAHSMSWFPWSHALLGSSLGVELGSGTFRAIDME